MIGAIIADFFFRQGDPGIGRLIDVYRQNLQTEQLLTSLLMSSLVGLVLFWSLDLLETASPAAAIPANSCSSNPLTRKNPSCACPFAGSPCRSP